VSRVGILDLDQHWGDGAHDIIGRLRLNWISHHSPGPKARRTGETERHLRRLPGILSTFHDCDLLLYQAGADAHVDYPLGGWMTSEQLAEATAQPLLLRLAHSVPSGQAR
jgi:acetoin utilization deacetylase AcuC-like enzyme